MGSPATGRLHLRPGTQLARFRIVRHLGDGSLGEVYLAQDAVRGEDVAVKVVIVAPGLSDRAAQLLQRERAAYDRIRDHSHVLKIHDVHQIPWGAAHLLVLSMEYADGGTFRSWLASRRDDWETRCGEGLEHFREICRAVAACHEAGVVHLDVKPENVLRVGGVWKLADLAVSSLLRELGRCDAPASGQSEKKLGAGTPAYMSPEQFTASCEDVLDRRSDIYALGILLYELLHPRGARPFGGTHERLCQLHCTIPAPPLPQATPALARVVARCLEKDPDRRYQSVGELLADLDGPDAEAAQAPREPEALWQQACQRLREGDLGGALRLCRRLEQDWPGRTDAQEMGEALQERYRQAEGLYAAVQRGIASRSLSDLADLLVQATRAFPDHPAGTVVQVELALQARQYRLAMTQGAEAVHRDDWEDALSWFQRARQLNPGAPQAEAPIRFVSQVLRNCQEARDAIDQALAAGRTDQAMGMARDLDEYLDEIRDALPEIHPGEEQ